MPNVHKILNWQRHTHFFDKNTVIVLLLVVKMAVLPKYRNLNNYITIYKLLNTLYLSINLYSFQRFSSFQAPSAMSNFVKSFSFWKFSG